MGPYKEIIFHNSRLRGVPKGSWRLVGGFWQAAGLTTGMIYARCVRVCKASHRIFVQVRMLVRALGF